MVGRTGSHFSTARRLPGVARSTNGAPALAAQVHCTLHAVPDLLPRRRPHAAEAGKLAAGVRVGPPRRHSLCGRRLTCLPALKQMCVSTLGSDLQPKHSTHRPGPRTRTADQTSARATLRVNSPAPAPLSAWRRKKTLSRVWRPDRYRRDIPHRHGQPRRPSRLQRQERGACLRARLVLLRCHLHATLRPHLLRAGARRRGC